MSPPPEIRTPGSELLGSTAGMIFTAVAAVGGLAVLLGIVYLAAAQPGTRRLKLWRHGEDHDAPPEGEISPGQGAQPWQQIEHRHVPEGGHPHGKPSSWVLVAVIIAAFTAGGVSIVVQAWWLFWTSAGIVVLCVPAGKVVGIMNDTVSWGSTSAASEPPQEPGAAPAADSPQRQDAGQPATLSRYRLFGGRSRVQGAALLISDGVGAGWQLVSPSFRPVTRGRSLVEPAGCGAP